MVQRLVKVEVDREERKGKQPSDHAPVVAEFND
jgi:exodeoxyribonuclease-3